MHWQQRGDGQLSLAFKSAHAPSPFDTLVTGMVLIREAEQMGAAVRDSSIIGSAT